MRRSPSARLDAVRRKAYRVLRCEQIWQAVRWPVLLLLLWLLGSLVHVPQYLPDNLRYLAEFALVIIGFFYGFWRIRHLPPVTKTEIDRRLELESGLDFHPLHTLADQPALMGSAQSRELQLFLWQHHCARLLKSLKKLRVGPPHLFVTRKAKTLLFLVTLFGVGAGLNAGPYGGTRLLTALLPWADDDTSPLPHLQAWIERPVYAPGAPVFLGLHQTQNIPVLPEGSVLHILLTDIKGRPSLSGAETIHETQLSSTSWQAEAPLHEDGSVTLHVRGRMLVSWPITLTPDAPPLISWTNNPGVEKGGWRVFFPWEAEQNFGLARLSVILKPVTHSGEANRDFEIPLPLDGTPAKAKKTTMLDLSAHPLAGLKVTAQLKAESLSGKISYSQVRTLRLGARPFHNALARALISLRQRMVLNLDIMAETRRDLALLASLVLPEDEHLPLCLMLTRLETPGASLQADRESLQEKLWYMALYAEDRQQDGLDMALSMADLRAAHQEVLLSLNAMARHSTTRQAVPQDMQENLHQNLDWLKKALDRRMSLMMQKASETGLIMPLPQGKMAPWNSLANKVEEDAMEQHIDKARAHLQDMMDMAEQMHQADGTDLQALARQMAARQEEHALRSALRDLIRDETILLNHSQARFVSATQNQDAETQQDVSQMSTEDLLRQLGMAPPDQQESRNDLVPDAQTVLEQGDDRQNDHSLQYGLKKLDSVLLQRGQKLTGKKNNGLEKAGEDMQTALTALARRQDHDATQAEQKVLEDLAAAQKQMREQEQKEKKDHPGRLGFIPPPQPDSSNQGSGNGGGSGSHSQQNPDHGQGAQDPDRDLDEADPDDQDDSDSPDDTEKEAGQQNNKDPLGRKTDNSEHSDAHIPDSQGHDQARKIEKELRKRASDQTRPKSELDYLNRLLAPFRDSP